MIYIKLIIFFSILDSCLCLRPFNIRFVSYTYEYRKEYYQSISFELLKQSKVIVVNGSFIFNRDLDNFDVSTKVTVNEKNKNRRPWDLMDITLDACKLLGGASKRSTGLVPVILKNLKSFSNMVPDRCPLKKGTEYYVDHLYLNAEFFPPRIPYVSVNVSFGLMQKKVPFYKANFLVVVEKRK